MSKSTDKTQFFEVFTRRTCSARQRNGSASCTARVASRLTFQATRIRRPTVSNRPTAGTHSTGRPPCYTAKDLGRNRVYTFRKRGLGKSELQTELVHIGVIQKALEENSFCLYCQPIQPLQVNTPKSPMFEVLLRLISNHGTLIHPAMFIPIAERYGLMPSIDRWMIRETFRRAAEVTESSHDRTFTINLSGHTINEESLFDFIAGEMANSGFHANRLCIEITETAAIHNFSHAADLMAALRRQGCRFALDDFGKGVSSMAYLKHLSVDYLKIDGSFVQNMADNQIDRTMVSAMNDLAHALGIETVAECVENPVVVEHLCGLGVDYVQGFAVGAPEPMGALLSGAIGTG